MTALSAIKVLDLTRLLPFAFGSMMLADLGAEVLKIEEPDKGDYMRMVGPKRKKESYIFLMCNRNKKSMTLDLRSNEGKEILFKLVKDSDILLESFRPGVADRLGIGYETIREKNPKIIYCSATGYGQSGPYKDKPGHDINYVSIAGILGMTGRHLEMPVIPGIPIADMSVGIFLAFAALVGIMARERTGEGQYIDISMTDIMVAYNIFHLAVHLSESEISEDLNITGGALFYESFETKDGKFISFGNVEKKFWDNFCEVIERSDLKAYQFASGDKKNELMRELREFFLSKTREEWLELLENKEICYSPVNSIEEVFSDPHILNRQMILEMDHPIEGKIKQIGLPIKFSKTPFDLRLPPPVLGQDTIEILSKLGYKEKINELKRAKVI